MSQAAERIRRFVAARTLDDYLKDEFLRSAVERQFEIIGEAMTRLIKLDESLAQQITDYRKIAGFRNALIHGYDTIDHPTSWAIIIEKLPVLEAELRALQAKE